MAKTQIINLLVNTYNLDRTWLQQFQAVDLEDMYNKFKLEIGGK